VIIWDLGPLKKSKVLAANLGSVTTLAFSPDGANLAAGGTLGIIRVWETSSWKEAWSTQAHKATMWPVAALWSLQFSPDSRMLASASNDNTVGLWLPDSSKPGQFARHYQLSGHTSEVTDVAFSPDSSSLASASMDKTVVIWDTKTMRQLRVIAEAATGASVAFSPNGSLLAIGRMDGKTELRDPISGALVRLLEKHDSGLLEKYDSGVMSVAFDRQGQILATASSGFLRRGDIQLWDCGTGGLARTLKP
jgi:WD40 repeat protein